jgi:sortase A
MLLRVGVIMVVVALALAAGATAMVVLRAEEPAPANTPTEPLAVETKARENKPDLGEKLEIDDEPDEKPEVNEKPEADHKPPEKPKADSRAAEKAPEKLPSEQREAKTLPVSVEDWPRPSRRQVAAANRPRHYQPQQGSQLSLTVQKMGLYDAPVINSYSLEALDRGVMHLPQTPMPWDERRQKNVYLAGHRLGWPGTGSHMVFYNLDELKKGDSVVLEDSSGNAYEYEVSEVFVAEPGAEWVMDPVRGRDMVTLQTCTYPDLKNRLIIRADRA